MDEQDFQHFLSYSGLSDLSEIAKEYLRIAFHAGCDSLEKLLEDVKKVKDVSETSAKIDTLETIVPVQPDDDAIGKSVG